ncbi:MAG: ATP-binding cassette domain-containing protein [Sphaerochaetaceae bacterium]
MNTEMGNESLLRVEGVSKAFPGVQALDKVDFEIKRGEVHFLIGENGAGKSTLINILSGKFPPDEGKIWLGGEQVLFARPIDAQKAGIKTIHQEFMLLPNLDVAENITIGHRPMVMGPIVNWKETYRIAEEILGKLNVKLDLKRKVSTLLASEKQIVRYRPSLARRGKAPHYG